MRNAADQVARALLVAPRMEPRGTSEYTLQLARELRGNGVAVSVFCVPGPMLPLLEKEGVPVETFEHLESSGLHFGERRRLFDAAVRFAPRIVHAQSVRVAGAVRMLSRRSDVPLVLTVHWRPRRAHMLARLSRRLMGIIATTQDVREELVNECGIDRSKVTVIHNGIDVARTGEHSVLPIFSGRVPTVGSLGPVEEQRGQGLFVEAAASLARDGPAVQFVVAGEGAELPGIRRRIRSMGLERQMTLVTNFGAYEEVVGALDVVVQSSLVDVSGFSILTAMGCGRPVVAFNTGTACEIIEDGKTGLLVPKGDVEALAGAVQGLLQDRDAARRIGESARLRVQDKFDIRTLARETLRYYASLLNG